MVGTQLANRYELLGELGRGGMATVYRAHDPRLDREVAIKLIAAEKLAPGVGDRFQREAELIAGLDHSSIVPIYDFGSHGRWLFLVMPVLRGFNVHQLLQQRRLGLETTLEVTAQVAEVLAYSAGRGVIHRDIKPENIMVSLDEADRLQRLWVMDFGLAVGDASARLTRTGSLPGTLGYLSPEQILTGETDGRSDLYSLGVILYECLAGRTPFVGSPASVLYRIVHETPPSLLPHGVDEPLEALVLKCLEKDPDARWQTGDQLAGELRGRLHRLRPGASRPLPEPSGREAPSDLPIVGRDLEIGHFEEMLDRAADGACQLALMGGERGLGSSRMCREVEILARRRGFTVLKGR
ncbi:MAG: serine/threonine-protein kinase, partial [Acidobacteriota bacterium]